MTKKTSIFALIIIVAATYYSLPVSGQEGHLHARTEKNVICRRFDFSDSKKTYDTLGFISLQLEACGMQSQANEWLSLQRELNSLQGATKEEQITLDEIMSQSRNRELENYGIAHFRKTYCSPDAVHRPTFVAKKTIQSLSKLIEMCGGSFNQE